MAAEHLESGRSELRCAVSVSIALGFEDQFEKIDFINNFCIDYVLR